MAYESPRRRSALISSFPPEVHETPRYNRCNNKNNWNQSWDGSSNRQQQQQYSTGNLLPSTSASFHQPQSMLSSIALALTPKAHNKRRRPSLSTISIPTVNSIANNTNVSTLPQPPSFPSPSLPDTIDNGTINGTSITYNRLDSYTSFDCQSLRRSLKRVRLSTSPCKLSNNGIDTNETDVKTTSTSNGVTSERNPNMHASGCKQSLYNNSNNKSPGEIRLQKDIQHAIIHHSWNYVDRDQQQDYYYKQSHPFSQTLSEPNSLFAGTNTVNVDDDDMHGRIETENCSDTEQLHPIDILSSQDFGNEEWTIPSLLYNPNTEVLHHKSVNNRSHVNSIESSYSCETAYRGDSMLDHSCFVVNAQMRRKSNDPMNFIIRIQLGGGSWNDPTTMNKIDNPNQANAALTITTKIQIPRLYPHQPPVVQIIEHSISNCGDPNESTQSISTIPIHADNTVNCCTTMIAKPTIWIDPNPRELAFSSSRRNVDTMNMVDSFPLYPGNGSPDSGSADVVISEWTPLARFADIVEMIIIRVCKWYNPTVLKILTYNGEHFSALSGGKELLNVGTQEMSSESMPINFDEKKEEIEIDYSNVPSIPFGKNIDDIVTENVAATSSVAEDSNGKNTTPTMSNTTFRRLRQQCQQTTTEVSTYGWNTFNAFAGDTNDADGSNAQLLNASDNGYRSPLRRNQQRYRKYHKSNGDISTSSDDSDKTEVGGNSGSGGCSDSMEVAASTSASDDANNAGYNLSSNRSNATLIFDNHSMVLRYDCGGKVTSSDCDERTNSQLNEQVPQQLSGGPKIVDTVLPAEETFPPNRFNIGYDSTENTRNSSGNVYCLRPSRSLLGGHLSSSLFEDDDEFSTTKNNPYDSIDTDDDDQDEIDVYDSDDDLVRYSPSNDFTLASDDDDDDDSTMDEL